MICWSVRTGVVSASLMLQRLGAYPRHNGPRVGAARDWPVVLDWLEDSQLRRQTIVELNKGEARNGLARAVSLPSPRACARPQRRGATASRSGLTLVTAIIVLWNTVHLTRALDRAPPRRRPGHRRSARPPRPAGLAPHSISRAPGQHVTVRQEDFLLFREVGLTPPEQEGQMFDLYDLDKKLSPFVRIASKSCTPELRTFAGARCLSTATSTAEAEG